MTTKLYSPKTLPNPARMLIRPILFVAVAAHALLLFVPLPSEEKPKEPDDQKNPVKITQLPTAKPPEPKAKPKTPAAPAKTVSVSAKPAASVTSTPGTVPTIPSSPVSTPVTSTVPSQPLPPEPSDPTSTLLAASRASIKDPVRALYELIAAMPEPDQFDASAGTANRLDLIEDPSIFFQASSDPDAVPEPLPGLASSPLFTPGEEPPIFFETYFGQPLQGIFEKINKVGEYGGGPLYQLEKGSYKVFLSLVPPKQGTVGAIVSVWSKDPRSK